MGLIPSYFPCNRFAWFSAGWSEHGNSRDIQYGAREAHKHTHTRSRAHTTGNNAAHTHTCLHLLQSHGSLNIRGAAYPLPPCVKPFLQGCVVSHWVPVQQRYSLGYTLHLHAISEGRTVSPTPTYGGKKRESDGQTHAHLLISVSLCRSDVTGERCVRTMGTCCVTAECWGEANLKGLFEIQALT